ncbi:hypothetical protein L9F63_005951, partial [Diploptera punctata]
GFINKSQSFKDLSCILLRTSCEADSCVSTMLQSTSNFFLVLLLLFATSCQTALKLPDYIKPCAKNNPNFNECALKSARNAIPQFIN